MCGITAGMRDVGHTYMWFGAAAQQLLNAPDHLPSHCHSPSHPLMLSFFFFVFPLTTEKRLCVRVYETERKMKSISYSSKHLPLCLKCI